MATIVQNSRGILALWLQEADLESLGTRQLKNASDMVKIVVETSV